MTAARSNLDAALGYAAQGLPVFPCLPRGKEPAIKRGFHAATTNPETIRRYWRVPDRNIGIATGALSGVWVLDIDGDDGAASLRALEAQHGKLPETWSSSTGRGRHIWFRYTGPIPSSAGRIAPGLDVRGDGGYVVAPPSSIRAGAPTRGSSRPRASSPTRRTGSSPLRARGRRRRSRNGRSRASAGRMARPERPTAPLRSIARSPNSPPPLPERATHALNRAPFRLFQLVAGGELDGRNVVDRLVEACHRNGLVKDDGLRSVVATIRSGARAGLQHPRSRSGAA